jgi:hypothetical protein
MDEIRETESADAVIFRLTILAGITLLAWCFVLFIAWSPTLTTGGTPETQAVRLGATIMLTQLATFLLVQTLAPRVVVESRLLSNTIFSLVITTVCAAITIALPLVPSQSLARMKMGAMLGFNPIFVVANILVCVALGLLIYRLRNLPLFDYVELYWNLGLFLLMGIGVGLIHFLVK